jgi:xanthine dehydrogenase YagR molybdenum-binding subunit
MADDASGTFGRSHVRVDGVAKVTGQAHYGSDEPVGNAAYAWLVTSAISRGRVTGFKLAVAKAVPGVLDILTHENVGKQVQSPQGPDQKPTTTTLESDKVWHDGQIVAIVVADTLEAAREAANKVQVAYAAEKPSATFDSPGAKAEPRKEDEQHKNPKVGDFKAGFTGAPVKIDVRYSTPTQHHNPIELFTTTCVWEGDKLTVYEPTQNMYGLRAGVAKQLGLDPSKVRTVSRYVGGGFGSRGSPTSRTAWIALAAKRVGRPVKLVATRDQGFTIATYRAETRHHVQLAATRDGKFTALRHEGWELTSRPSNYNVSGTDTTARMYACPNVETKVNIVHADRNTPGFMRAPPDTPYMFALECAVDEMACALNLDPIELRRINDTQSDPIEGKPYSSRSLMKCFDQAAERFDWRRRNPKPGSMREGDWLIGLGCATAAYPSNIGPAAARLSLSPDGKATLEMAGHEIGTGAYTILAMTAAERLGLPVEAVTVLLGDSNLPPVPGAGGSNNAASTSNVAAKACEEIRGRIAAAAVQAKDGAFSGADPARLKLANMSLTDGTHSEPLAKALGRVSNGPLEVLADNVPDGLPADSVAGLYKGQMQMLRGGGRKDVIAYAFGAHLVEVRVHARTREVRAHRVVSAFAAGTILNPVTAYSQFMGGAIWGLSSALHEQTEIDLRTARYVNDNLADYLIPVNADVPDLQIIMVPEVDDKVNPLGVKGIGEIGIVGMNAAVANAVYHATGKRIRDLPIRASKLL